MAIRGSKVLFFIGFFFSIIFAWPFIFGFELFSFTVVGAVFWMLISSAMLAVNYWSGEPMVDWFVCVLAYLSVGLIAAISIFCLIRNSLGQIYDKIFDKKS